MVEFRRAFSYIFADRRWPLKLGPAALIASVPLIGTIFLAAFAIRAAKAVIVERRDDELPEWRWDREAVKTGLVWQLLTIVCWAVAGTVGIIGFGIEGVSPDASSASTALATAFRGPTYLLVTAVNALLVAVVLARYAATGSAWTALDPGRIWSHLRAEPALWICVALLGFVVVELPLTVVTLLPLSLEWETPLVMAVAALCWPFAYLVQAHLAAQAYLWSARTMAVRSAYVRYRW